MDTRYNSVKLVDETTGFARNIRELLSQTPGLNPRQPPAARHSPCDHLRDLTQRPWETPGRISHHHEAHNVDVGDQARGPLGGRRPRRSQTAHVRPSDKQHGGPLAAG